MHDLSSGL